MAGRTWHTWATRTVAIAGLCALALLLIAAGGARADAPRVLGVNLEGAPHNAAAIDDYTHQVGAAPGIVMWYQAWSEPAFTTGDADNVRSRGATPLITWMPQMGSAGIKLADIALGRYDQYVLASARQAAAYKHPLMFRFAHEMNLKTSPWGPGVNGNTPADYINAWRHVVQLFRVSGATNVQWVWSPNVDYGQAPFTQFYPGDAWVDWVALDGYNWGPSLNSGWKELGDVFGPSYDTLTRLTAKPLMIAETASTENGGNKAQWILNGFQQAIPQRLPRVRAIVWFSRNKETDWRVNSSPTSLLAYRQIAGSAAYTGTVPPADAVAPPAPAAAADGPPTPVASRSQAVSRLAVRGKKLHVASQRVAVRVACLRAPGARCTGTVALSTTGRGRTLLGLGRFSVRAHHSAIAEVKLSRAGRRQLRAHHGRLSALVTVVSDEAGALPVHRRLRLSSGR